MSEASINVFSNDKLDMLFVERGSVFNQILEGSKEIHQMAIDEERTDLLDFNDWLLLQFYCFQLEMYAKKGLLEEFK
tara:strand:- start:1126 stop:1356 length:231 start_codon:yes stop_codon:yes gene_type:complete